MSGASRSDEKKHALEPASVQKAFVLTAFSFGALMSGYVAAALFLFTEIRIGMLIGLGVAALSVMVGMWSRRTGAVTWPARLFMVATIICAAFVALINGGADGYIAPFLMVTPIAAAYFLGARACVIFGVIAVLCVAGLHIADVAGLTTESPFPLYTVRAAAALVLITVILLVVITSTYFARDVYIHSAELEHSRALLDSMSEVAGVGGWELDFKTMQPVWTDQTCKIHEVDDDFVPDFESAVSFYAPAARDKIKQVVEKCINEGAPFDVELPLTTAKGRDIWVRSVGQRICEKSVPVKLIGAFQDITRQREEKESLAAALRTADQALSDLSAYQTALDQNAIVAITDAKGTITFVNDKFCELSGYSRNELIGANHSILNSGTHPKPFFKEMWRAILNGDPWNGEICNRAKDGRRYWVDSTIIPIRDTSGDIQRFVSIRYDITDRVVYAKELEKRRVEAEAANLAKSQFLATMSHEIRTPMNGVMGMLELMLREDMPEEQKRRALVAQNSAQTLLTIINDVLDFSKIEAGQVELESIAFNPKQMIERAIALMSVRAEESGLALKFEPRGTIPEWVEGDPTRLTQVLINLIGNALKFTREGQIVVIAEYIDKDGGDLLRVSVQDTGIGISEHDQQKLFERFVQADATTTRKFGGSGLGLAISKQLVELMGGEIGVVSAPGEGSTFWFAVRTKRTSAQAEPRVELEKTDTVKNLEGPLEVLVAEDNIVNQQIIEAFLRMAGHAATVVNNGSEAVGAIQAKQFDIVLMDIQMPVMDGVAAAKAIRSLPAPGCNVPIVAVTANAMAEDRDQYLASGMNDYVSKPVQSAALMDVINRVMSAENNRLAAAG